MDFFNHDADLEKYKEIYLSNRESLKEVFIFQSKKRGLTEEQAGEMWISIEIEEAISFSDDLSNVKINEIGDERVLKNIGEMEKEPLKLSGKMKKRLIMAGLALLAVSSIGIITSNQDFQKNVEVAGIESPSREMIGNESGEENIESPIVESLYFNENGEGLEDVLMRYLKDPGAKIYEFYPELKDADPVEIAHRLILDFTHDHDLADSENPFYANAKMEITFDPAALKLGIGKLEEAVRIDIAGEILNEKIIENLRLLKKGVEYHGFLQQTDKKRAEIVDNAIIERSNELRADMFGVGVYGEMKNLPLLERKEEILRKISPKRRVVFEEFLKKNPATKNDLLKNWLIKIVFTELGIELEKQEKIKK